MVDTKNLMSEFKRFNVGERETKLYLALLEHGESNANDLQRITGLPRTKIYSILSGMVVTGLCQERLEGRYRFFTAERPVAVLEMLQHQWREALQDKEEHAKKLLNDLEKEFPLIENGSYVESIEVIRNPAHIHQRYLALLEQTESEILCFNRAPYAATTKKAVEEQMAAQTKATARGVRNLSILIRDNVPIDSYDYKTLNENDEMRITNDLPLKLFVFDRKRVFFAIPSTSVSSTKNFSMILIDDEGVAKCFAKTFQIFWEESTPIERYFQGQEIKKSED